MTNDDNAHRRRGVPLRGLWLLATDPEDDSPVVTDGLLTVPAEIADLMDPEVLRKHYAMQPQDDDLPPSA